MADYRTLKVVLWSDPFIESLSANGKLLYLYLITSPHTNNLGLLEISQRRMSLETGLDNHTIDLEMRVLEEAGKLVKVDGSVWLTRFISNQTSCAPRVVAGLRRQFERVKSSKLTHTMRKHYPHIFNSTHQPEDAFLDGMDTISDGMDTIPDGMDTISDGMDTISDGMDTILDKERKGKERKGKELKGTNQNQKLLLNDGSQNPELDLEAAQKEPGGQSEYEARLLDAFQKFWELYPRRVAKKAAEKAWMALFKAQPRKRHADLLRGIAMHVDEYREEIETRGTTADFVKHPSTWLRATDFFEPPENMVL